MDGFTGLEQELYDRGMGHIADELQLASERPWYRNEAVPVVEEGAGLAGLDPTGAPAAPALVEPAAPAPAEPAWTGPSREEWQATQQVMQFLGEALRETPAEPAPAGPAAPGLPELDVYNPDSVKAHYDAVLEQRLEAMFSERLGAYQPVLDGVAEERGARLLEEGFTALEQPADKGGLGEKFDHQRAGILYGAFMSANPNLDPQIALRAAAEYRIADEKALRESGRTAYIEGLRTVENAPAAPPPAGGAAVPVTVIDGRAPDRYEKLANDWLARRSTPAAGVVG